MKARLGPDHPNTLVAMNNLALSYREAGRLRRSPAALRGGVGLMKAKLGPDHPDTLIAMSNLGTGPTNPPAGSPRPCRSSRRPAGS